MNELAEYGVPFALAAMLCLLEGLFLVGVLFAWLAIRCTFQWFRDRTIVTEREGVTHGR